jgi:tetratricopeptide (TPR) repeat protein
MTNILSRALPPPSNWQDFERLCFDVFSRIWKTNDAQMHGRVGQPQAGVDIYGTDRVEGMFAGVQCKGKDQGYENPLTATELRDEVQKALSFAPPLSVFTLATTAPNDETIQKLARDITNEHKAKGLFEVRVEGWTNLRQRLTNYPEIVAKYFSDLAPVDMVRRVEAGVRATREEGAETRALIQQNQTAIISFLERNDPGDALHTRIVDAAKLVEEGEIVAGLKVLERLWSSESANATPRNRYLIRANIGFARLVLGDTPAAIAELRASAAEEPTWPNARAVLATAEMYEGNREKAFAIAEAALAENPAAHQAATVLIETAPNSTTVADLEARIPAALRGRLDVLLILANRARDTKDSASRASLIARAATLFPKDWRVLSAQAELLLEPIFGLKGLVFSHAVPAARVPDLERAIAWLQEAWTEVKKRDNAGMGVFVAANLLAAFELAGRTAEYERLLSEALEVAPTYNVLLRRYAQSMVAVDDWQAAAKALDAIPAESIEIPDRLFKIQVSIHVGKAPEAIAAAKLLEFEIGSGRDAEIAAGLQIEAARTANRVDDVLPEVLARWPNSVILRSLAHSFLPEGDPRRATLLSEIKTLARGITDPGDRVHAAEALFIAKQYSAAADMYEGLYSRDQDTATLHRALTSLFYAERRKDARKLFDSLSSALKSKSHYAELGSAIYEQAGLLREARGYLELALAHDDTLHRRMRWISLSERIPDIAAIIRWLGTISPDLQGAPQDLMHVALAMDRLQGDPKCFRFAYRALRAGYADPSMHLAYMMGLVVTGKSQKQAFSRPTEVGPDTAVLMTEKDGPKKLVRILETEPTPRIERNEIAPEAELGPVLIGRKVGDEIEVPSLGPGPTIYVIREIRDKYLHAHFRSLEQFESLFPGHQAFGSLHIDESKGADKFEPVFESAKRRAEFAEQLAEMYRTGQIPLMLLSKYSGNPPSDAWEWVSAHADLGIRACVGVPEEFTNASDLLANNRKAVIDPITLYALTRLGVAEKVRPCFEDLGVAQTTIDLFRRLVDQRTKDRDKNHGSMGWDGGHLQLVTYGDALKDAQIECAQAALSFAETLTLIAAEPSVAIAENLREIFEDVDPCFLDTIYAAQGANRLLYSDEFMFRQLAADLSKVGGVWTQAAAFPAMRAGMISVDDYLEVVAGLVSHHYSFTTIDFRSVLHQLTKDNWQITPALLAFATQIAAPTNDPDSVVRLMADLAQVGWGQKPDRGSYVGFFAALINAQQQAQPGRNAAAYLAPVREMLRARLRSTGYRLKLKWGLKGSTHLTPILPIIARLTASADLAFQPIDDALAAALIEATLRKS